MAVMWLTFCMRRTCSMHSSPCCERPLQATPLWPASSASLRWPQLASPKRRHPPSLPCWEQSTRTQRLGPWLCASREAIPQSTIQRACASPAPAITALLHMVRQLDVMACQFIERGVNVCIDQIAEHSDTVLRFSVCPLQCALCPLTFCITLTLQGQPFYAAAGSRLSQ